VTDDIFLRIKQVTAVTGLSRATIYNMMAIGTFPMKTALGVRAVGWLSSEIQNWMAERKLVEKRGVEAKPARRKVVTIRSGLSPKATIESRTPATTGSPSEERSAYLDWGNDMPLPSPAERNVTAERLRLINAMRRQKGTPVKVSSRTISAFDHLRRPAPAHAADDGSDAVAPKTSNKRKV
jgi:prophage regulatory protein